jgi:signal transduction histidine kinase
MVITKRIYFLIGVPMLLLVVATLFGAYLISKNNQNTQALIRESIFKQNLLSSIYNQSGYGGSIHHFKNLVLRRDLKYLLPAKEMLSDTVALCDEYLNIENITPLERKSIQQIKTTMQEYLAKADVVQILISQKKTVQEIDAVVRVDDTEAVQQSERIRSYLAEQQEKYENNFQQYQLNIFILLTVLFLAIIVLSITLTNTANNRIQKIIESAVRMARDVASGNYSPTVDESLMDDLDSLFRDIQTMAKNIQRKIEQLQTSNTDLKQFAFIAAHDLQEPLNKIMAYADLILLDDAENISLSTKSGVKKIISSGSRLRGLVHDLLTYADLASSARPDLHAELSESLDAARALIADQIAAAQATITATDLPSIKGSPKHFESLFANLISNSLKYRSPDRPCLIEISCVTENRMHKISFKDNGIGFDQAFAKQLMRPFVKLHDKNKYPGSGVGLAICSRILQIYESHLVITSELGKGTTCSFELPQEIHQHLHNKITNESKLKDDPGMATSADKSP